MIVADTNLIAYLFIEGEFTEQAELVYQSDPDWVAPYLWRSEFRNILALYLRKKFLELEAAKAIMFQAENLLSGKEFELDSESILAQIAQSSLSAYDCEYVVLAQKLGVKLVTSDQKILRSFPAITIDTSSWK
jgi:predicted nucleic acid-binding protein